MLFILLSSNKYYYYMLLVSVLEDNCISFSSSFFQLKDALLIFNITFLSLFSLYSIFLVDISLLSYNEYISADVRNLFKR